ncbi:methyltransferase domain-containing protein [Rhizodiscina lignyota]|uniref:Methyltransferase domain-containing protein n=1 Tax=Rhizodiscina lignyota TaxID=1504668 RepID=A0A9P4MAA8_9PEZI|nr:methyltransferase domain-containing protein [Rhizodiscina lignyota]
MESSQDDPKELSRTGYNQGAARYLEWMQSHAHRRVLMLDKLYGYLGNRTTSATALELGCGAGDPVTISLAERCQHVTANDISSTQIAMAKERLSGKTNFEMIESDMMELEFADGSFDTVVAFYSIIHLEQGDQKELIGRIGRWLRKDGYLLCSFAAAETPKLISNDWLGMRMFWSSFGTEKSLEMVQEAGLTIVEKEITNDDDDAPFVFVIARKE